MKKLLLITALVLSAAGLSGAATAAGCDTTGVNANQATSDSVANVCVQPLGYAEAGTTADTGGNESYVVVQSQPGGPGYVGVSNYEAGADGCQAPSGPDGKDEGGTGTNSGGCYGGNTIFVPAPTGNAVPLPVCGDDTGPWNGTTRDGCRADTEDVEQLLP